MAIFDTWGKFSVERYRDENGCSRYRVVSGEFQGFRGSPPFILVLALPISFGRRRARLVRDILDRATCPRDFAGLHLVAQRRVGELLPYVFQFRSERRRAA